MEQSSRPIDPNDLLLFACVADLGSFSRAADKLGLPKSTVSRRLAGLEQRLGERLLLRTTRRQVITEFGEQLLGHARQVADEVDAVAALSAHRQDEPRGLLRVSMPSDFANILLADTLAAFMALHPAITLELDLSPRRVDLLGEGFDVAVRIGDLSAEGLLAARRLTVLATGLYAAPAYLDAQGRPATPQDLQQHQAIRLAGASGDPAAWSLTRGDQQWQGVPAGRLMANSPELLTRLAAAGAGIAAVPEVLALAELRAGRLQRVLPDWRLPTHTVWAVFPERKLMPTKTRAFVDMLSVSLGTPAAAESGL